MRRSLLALTGLALALASVALAQRSAPAPAPPPVTATTFVLSGRGWGHGVGMSQYGALGFANDGWTYDRILAHYYRGAELGPAGVSRVRVLVAEAKASVAVGSKAPFRIRDGVGATHFLEAGVVELGPRLRVSVGGVPQELPGPLLFLPGGAPLEVDGVAYRGQVDVSVAGQRLHAVNVVGLEQYLFGVVPREMPSAWHEEALKAQAVAARSYALSHRVGGGKGFDLYADVRSQVYGGIPGEHPRATAAVQATAGEVMLWQGKPIDALFHSTSGGATADVEEVFGRPIPYLVGVDDPHSALSPVHRWGPVAVPEATIRRGLKLRSPIGALRLTRAPSGRVATVRAVTPAGTTSFAGTALRAAGGLRSTWITQLASLSLTRPGGPVVYGRAVTITGKAVGLKNAVLQERVNGAWQPVGRPGTTFTVRRKPTERTAFRLSAGRIAGPVLAVPVAPLVTAKAAAERTVSGVVRPLDPGTTVELQREGERGWWTLAQTTTGPDGEYTLVAPEPGVYRARVAPSAGFAQGLSGQIELP